MSNPRPFMKFCWMHFCFSDTCCSSRVEDVVESEAIDEDAYASSSSRRSSFPKVDLCSDGDKGRRVEEERGSDLEGEESKRARNECEVVVVMLFLRSITLARFF